MRKCDSCGKLYQESKDVFCPHCGAVAQKQCTHASSFDSNRYDRGEIYKGNTTQYQNATYNKGFEPHAQREKYTSNKAEGGFSNAEQYSYETQRKSAIPDIGKVFNKGSNKTIIGVIVTVCIIVFNVFVANISSFDDVNGTDYWSEEEMSEHYIDEAEFYAVSSSASVSISSETGMSKDIEISIDDMWLPYEANDSYEEFQEYILKDGALTEINVCTFSEATVSEELYDQALTESYCISSNYGHKPGHYQFTYEFDYDEIVHIIGGVSFYGEDGVFVNIELPFSAFSVSEDGKITYYTSYADESTDWNTVFSECSNEQEIDGDISIDFGSVVAVEGE